MTDRFNLPNELHNYIKKYSSSRVVRIFHQLSKVNFELYDYQFLLGLIIPGLIDDDDNKIYPTIKINNCFIIKNGIVYMNNKYYLIVHDHIDVIANIRNVIVQDRMLVCLPIILIELYKEYNNMKVRYSYDEFPLEFLNKFNKVDEYLKQIYPQIEVYIHEIIDNMCVQHVNFNQTFLVATNSEMDWISYEPGLRSIMIVCKCCYPKSNARFKKYDTICNNIYKEPYLCTLPNELLLYINKYSSCRVRRILHSTNSKLNNIFKYEMFLFVFEVLNNYKIENDILYFQNTFACLSDDALYIPNIENKMIRNVILTDLRLILYVLLNQIFELNSKKNDEMWNRIYRFLLNDYSKYMDISQIDYFGRDYSCEIKWVELSHSFILRKTPQYGSNFPLFLIFDKSDIIDHDTILKDKRKFNYSNRE